MKGILTTIIGLASMVALHGQRPVNASPTKDKEVCGMHITQNTIDHEKNVDRKAFEEKMNRQMRSPLVHRDYVVQFHIVRRDDGTGGIAVANIRNEFDNWVNPYFAALDATFIECNPELYINSTEYYSLSGDAEGDAMAAANNVANVINIYFVDDPDDACGWARFPWDLPVDYVVIANGCATNKSTLVHELGHYFGLYHTHETGVGDGAENVTRDGGNACYNCSTAGDLLCDTPADPRLNRDEVTISASCIYSSTLTDGCGVSYTPDEENIMSYSLKACRTIFSTQQVARMGVYDDDRSYINSSCPCEKPQAFCRSISVDLNSSGSAGISPSDIDNGSTYDCGLDSWSVTPNAFDCGDVGPNLVTLTITDDLGWVSTCQATVTVRDVTNPQITPASDMTVECDGNGNVAQFIAWLNNHGGATASDACGGTWSNNSSALSDGCGATGSEEVTFTFTDPSGNSSSTSATFTIVDTSQPSVTCPADIHLPECVPTASWVVEASDVCGDVTVVSVPPSGSEFPYGSTTTVIVTVTDDCGNTNTCDFVVERDPELLVNIDPVGASPLNTCAVGTNANIILGYGGGPVCVTLNAIAVGGHAPYTYSWAIPDAVPAGKFTGGGTNTPTFCADFQTAHCVTYTFVVTVVDIHGCEETTSIDVNVLNVGVFANGDACASIHNPKVVVCHDPVGPVTEQSLCVGQKAVATHLFAAVPGHEGDCLGDCNAVCISEVPNFARAGRSVNPSESNTSAFYQLNVMPNPVTDNAIIEIIARENTEGRLSIFDLTGRVVETLYDGRLERGVPYAFTFLAGKWPEGLYVARLIGVDGDVMMTPVVVIR